MDFGNRIKTLRKELNLTREELAVKFGISYSTLSKYETNERFPDKETVRKFADFFEVSIDYLFGRIDVRDFKKNDIEKEYDLDNILLETKRKLEKEHNLMFSGEVASRDAVESILNALEMGLALAKQKQENSKK